MFVVCFASSCLLFCLLCCWGRGWGFISKSNAFGRLQDCSFAKDAGEVVKEAWSRTWRSMTMVEKGFMTSFKVDVDHLSEFPTEPKANKGDERVALFTKNHYLSHPSLRENFCSKVNYRQKSTACCKVPRIRGKREWQGRMTATASTTATLPAPVNCDYCVYKHICSSHNGSRAHAANKRARRCSHERFAEETLFVAKMVFSGDRNVDQLPYVLMSSFSSVTLFPLLSILRVHGCECSQGSRSNQPSDILQESSRSLFVGGCLGFFWGRASSPCFFFV